MSVARAFISFDYDHNKTNKELFIGQCTNSRTPFSVADWSAKEAMPQSEWKNLVEAKMKKTNMVIILVGRFMATATGVEREIKMAKENNIPYFGIYVDGAGFTSNLPAGLARNQVIGWTWDKIADKIDEMMTKGKNR